MATRPKLASLLLALLTLAPAALSAEVLNRIVLRVNDQIATLHDYEKRRQDLVRDITRRVEDPEERRERLAEAGEIVFADMYQELLLRSRAEQLGVTVTEAQVDTAVAQLRENFGIKTDQEFQAALAQSGLTEAQMREQLRGNLRMQEVRGRDIQSRIKVDEEDLRRYYRKNQEQFRQPEQVRLQEVVVLEEGGLPTAEERAALANQIRQAVLGGKPLAEAVAEHAQKGGASNVIDIGWVSPGDLDPALEAAAWKLQPGALSEPVPARGGLHLLQVNERRESRIPPFSEVAQAIQARENERVFRQEMVKYMDELERKALIVAQPPQEAANYRRRIETGAPVRDELEELTGGTGDQAAPPASDPAPAPTQLPGTLPEPKPVNPTPPPPPPGASR